ncbi:uL15 family ribosomal protein [Candidatus Vidania fulgoroideae]|uniref:50S ribosomal protein L15 n=1 Tax=Candidatus Vidania fulgoroideorum TaxID=881286 RepID=A0A974X9R4_9PROT|nr:uL15 family ribosomal protein [Candidatus Vidania fulgoroideae]
MSRIKKRLGRGNSSKKGNTCGRGTKGQKSRSGYSKKFLFSGGQTPINILHPKYGFRKTKKIKYMRHIKNRLKHSCIKSNCKFLLNCQIYSKLFLYNAKLSDSSLRKIEFIGGNVL